MRLEIEPVVDDGPEVGRGGDAACCVAELVLKRSVPMSHGLIRIRGARQHNLKNLDLDIRTGG